MIDPNEPDYANTPVSERRAEHRYRPASTDRDPVISIVTPCYNVDDWFTETVACVQRQSFQEFEWVLVDDGSTDEESVSALRRLAEQDPRVRLVSQANAGPAAARNRGAREARGRYVYWLDSDDLIEPTTLEKLLWCLESHPQFAFCNSWSVAFGTQNYLWPRGFDSGSLMLHENTADNSALIRRDVHMQVGGFDESIRVGHEDWDYWLNMAMHGVWGGTLREFLKWYRRRDDSRINLTERDAARRSSFISFMRSKYARLYEGTVRFPEPPDLDDLAPAPVSLDLPCCNPLDNLEGRPRLLLVAPWLAMGGADQFNLNLIAQLGKRGWEVTVATTLASEHVWLPQTTRLTPDVFCLDRFLRLADYPRFLLYLLRSRAITHVLVSNSQLAYELLPALRSCYPQAVYADYCHSETPDWKGGGYPAMAAQWTDCIDVHMVASNQLRERLLSRGIAPEKVKTCYIGVNSELFDPTRFDRERIRSELLKREGIAGTERPIILFVGRFVEDKRPKFLMDILRRLRDDGTQYLALLVGDGEDRPHIESYVAKHHLDDQVRLLAPVPNAQMPRLLAAADILLLPSQVEGISLALYEAMAMGVVPVSADVGGQAELVTPEVGHLIPHDEYEIEARVYVSVLRRLCDDPAYRRALSAAARRRIEEHFGLSKMGQDAHEMLLQANQSHDAGRQPALPATMATGCATLSIERYRLERLADDLWIRLRRRAHEQAAAGGRDPRTTPVSLARFELNYIENSRTWRAIQRIRASALYRLLSRARPGPSGVAVDPDEDPRERLTRIKATPLYRLVRFVRRTRLYKWYAHHRYGPTFVNFWE